MKKILWLSILGLFFAQYLSAQSNDFIKKVKHGFADNNGVKIHYATIGEGPLVVMLHGFPDYWYTWRHQMEALKDDFQLVAIDLRGYNLSGEPEGVENYTYPHLMGDVIAVIKHFKQEKAIIVGHDWGGSIAWNLAMKHPEVVEKLIICNIPHPAGSGRELAKKAKENNNQTYAAGFLAEDAYKNYSPQWLSGWVKDPEAKKLYLEAFQKTSRKGMFNYYRANFPSGDKLVASTEYKTPEYPPVKAPVLIIYGLQDRYLPKEGLNDTWNFLEQDLTLVTIPSAGHFVQQDAPEMVSKSMKMWLLRDQPAVNTRSKKTAYQPDTTKVQGDVISFLPLTKTLPSRSQLGGLTVDRLGYIYVANFLDAVWRISPAGEVKLLTDGLYGSSGNTLDKAGNLYQANFFAHSIVKIDRFGHITPFIEKGLNGPVGMIFDEAENLYVCNCSGNTISKITPAGEVQTFSEGDLFSCPNGISIDAEGNLIVVNFNNEQVIKITPDGAPSIMANIPGGGGNAHIVSYNDNFYISKIKTSQVYRLAPNGKYTLIAGTGQNSNSEGPALEAALAHPNGIGVDTQTGTLYVNTLTGDWTSRKPTTIGISRIKLFTLSDALIHHLDQNDIPAAVKAFWAYKNDPTHAHENLGPALGTLGWRYMSKRNVTAGIAMFEVLTEAYPERWQGYYFLGDVYAIIGQPEKAKAYYQTALEKSPDNSVIVGKIKGLGK